MVILKNSLQLVIKALLAQLRVSYHQTCYMKLVAVANIYMELHIWALVIQASTNFFE